MLNSSLPVGETTVQVSALPAGHLQLPDRWLFEDNDHDVLKCRQHSPDFAFLIKHAKGKVVFDLGMRKVRHRPGPGRSQFKLLSQDIENSPPVIKKELHLVSVDIPKDVQELLDEGPDKAASITTVILSHLHFDHVGDCMKFPDSELVVGPGSHASTAPGWPDAPGSPFDGSVLKHPHFRELSPEKDWKPFGPFSKAIDWWGDQSFYVIDAPGHMDGHLAATARTGPDEWVFMGGDCCHHRSLLCGSRPLGVSAGPGGGPGFHRYPDVAKGTIQQVRALEQEGSVLIALAHDSRLDGLMPVYPEVLNGWRSSKWKRTLDEGLARDFPAEYPMQNV